MKLKLAIATAFLLILAITATETRAQQAKGPTRVFAIRAQLFYENTGKFSKDILSDPEFSLWNTGAGEGSAEGPSNATLITVEVIGNDSSPDNLKLELTATGKGGRIIQKKLFDVFIYREIYKFYGSMWVADTPCEPIKISARLIGKGAAAGVLVKTIPFACGE